MKIHVILQIGYHECKLIGAYKTLREAKAQARGLDSLVNIRSIEIGKTIDVPFKKGDLVHYRLHQYSPPDEDVIGCRVEGTGDDFALDIIRKITTEENKPYEYSMTTWAKDEREARAKFRKALKEFNKNQGM